PLSLGHPIAATASAISILEQRRAVQHKDAQRLGKNAQNRAELCAAPAGCDGESYCLNSKLWLLASERWHCARCFQRKAAARVLGWYPGNVAWRQAVPRV